MALTTVHSAMEHLISKYSITSQDGTPVTIEQIMADDTVVTMLTSAMGKSSGRRSTEPGAVFNPGICRCRTYDSKSGLPKQCPGVHESNSICKTHLKKILNRKVNAYFTAEEAVELGIADIIF